MDFSYASEKIRSICEREAVAIRLYGPDKAQTLHARLSNLAAAKTVKDLLLGSCRLVPGDSDGARMMINFAPNAVLVFAANHQPENPTDASSGKVDWTKVRFVKIVHIEVAND